MTPSVLPGRLQPWYPMATVAGLKHGVDVFLILAVIDRESLGGQALTPKGPGGTGDKGNGLGLMQIDKRFHSIFANELLPDGTNAWANPTRNIDYGTSILHDNLIAFNGDEFMATAAYNAGVNAVQKRLNEVTNPTTEYKRRAAIDALTTGRNYPSDVLGRRDRFRIAVSNVPEEPPSD